MSVYTAFLPGLGFKAPHSIGLGRQVVLCPWVERVGSCHRAGEQWPAWLAQNHGEGAFGWGSEEAGPCSVVIAGTSLELVLL